MEIKIVNLNSEGKEETISLNSLEDVVNILKQTKEKKSIKPFTKIAVFDSEENRWIADFYSHYNNENNTHQTVGYRNVADDNISKDLSLIGKKEK